MDEISILDDTGVATKLRRVKGYDLLALSTKIADGPLEHAYHDSVLTRNQALRLGHILTHWAETGELEDHIPDAGRKQLFARGCLRLRNWNSC